jgi:hypothetical protein
MLLIKKIKMFKHLKSLKTKIMKKIYSIIVGLFMVTCVFAQTPNKMSYQAIIRNTSNALVGNSAVGMRISILQTSASGTAVYVETQTPTTNANGLASIEIGGGTVVSGNFSTINWANGPYFIKTETDPAGGTNYTITGTSQLLSVPYALYAANAGTASGGGNFTHYIGEEFGGGVIFHLWKDAQGVEHGLIVDKTDLSTSATWSNITNSQIGIAAESFWSGLDNNNAIIGQAGHTTSAAALCLNSTNSGQFDWYLPAIQELNILWNNYTAVGKTIATISGATQLSNNYYWSSTESNLGTVGTSAWSFNFLGSLTFDGSFKSTQLRVRAIRAF